MRRAACKGCADARRWNSREWQASVSRFSVRLGNGISLRPDRNAQAATICDAAQFIVSDDPVENSPYFSSNSMSSTRALRPYESHASYQVLASRILRGADSCRGPVGLRRFRRFPSIEHDAQSGRSLLKASRGLAGLQHKAPAAHAFVIHDLRITENTGSRGWREPAGLSVVKQERNVVEGCLSMFEALWVRGPCFE